MHCAYKKELLGKNYCYFERALEKFKSIYQENIHCVKSVRIQSYSGPYFSRIFQHSDWIRRDREYLSVRSTSAEYLSVFSPNAEKCGKMWTKITLNMDSFYAVVCSDLVFSRIMCFFETSTWSNAFFKDTEIIHRSSYSHPFYDTSLISGIYMLKDSLLFDNIKCSHPFYDTCLDSGTYILENSLFLTTSITATHLCYMVLWLFHGSTCSDPSVSQGHCVFFAALTVAIYYQYVVDPKKVEGYCFFEEISCSPAFLKVLFYSTELVAAIFV